jgi:GNAT superfamily N-acetyltransferase
MTSSRLVVRLALPSDAGALARIHAETWEDTYVGDVPDQLARERMAIARKRDWANHSDLRVNTGGGVLVLVIDGSIAGFCEYGPTEDTDDDAEQVGHIMRLYVHPQHQGNGGGRLLLESACFHLARSGYSEATLWTLETKSNLARRFYSHLGWSREGIDNGEIPPDVRYRHSLG